MPKQLELYNSSEDHSKIVDVKIRRLKVYYAAHNNTPYRHHPFIRLAGRYLLDFGFKTGDTVELTLSAGQIVIKKVKPE